MRPKVVSLGVIILDVLGWPCLELPPGQIGRRIEKIRMTAGGTAAGFAVDMAKLDADVKLVGSIGTDEIGDFLLGLLGRYEIDTTAVQRTSGAQTSSSMLPIRPNGERPAYHVVGANALFALRADSMVEILKDATHLHVGGADSMGDFLGGGLALALRSARDANIGTSLDVLGANLAHAREPIRSALQWVDYFMPNEQQLRELYETDDLEVAAAAALADGAAVVIVTCGEDGCYVARHDESMWLPAFDQKVVDTTGCGDAFSAAFLRAKLLGWDDKAAAQLGSAAGALVASELGSDAGITDLPNTINAMKNWLNQ
jgi:sugar/nucleoside kinase (ribokinase family)